MNSFLILAFFIATVSAHGQPKQDEERTFDHYIREDKDHLTEDIKEQLHVEIDPSKMTEGESQFYYFNLHDYDQNNKLDGLEVLLALQHDVPKEHSQSTSSTTPAPREGQMSDGERFHRKMMQEEANKRFEADATLVDDIMNNYDVNNDGYIEYDEFLYGRKKEMERYGPHN